MKIIIVSGPIGSGKSKVSEFFKSKGFAYINSDLLAKKIIKNNIQIQKKIKRFLGSNVFIKKKLSMAKLKKYIFLSKYNKDKIDSIVHPYFFKELNLIIKNTKNDKLVIEIPLIETCKNIKYKYKIISVISKIHKRIERLNKKNKKSIEYFNIINNFQRKPSFYIKNSDYIVMNNGTMFELKQKFNNIYKKINYE